MPGTLHLIPVSLGDHPSNPKAAPHTEASEQEAVIPYSHLLPPDTLARAWTLDYFIVEGAKTARAELKRMQHPTPLREINMVEIPAKAPAGGWKSLLQPLLDGKDAGLMSEAGCPAVADPGALIVREAHRLGITVAPLVGPSSLLLALMGSGLDGQRFAFHGYLPTDEQERQKTLRTLENESASRQQTQLFIETPYRNGKLLAALLATLKGDTRLCIARGLTTPFEQIQTRTVAEWKKSAAPELDRIPTVFLFLRQ